MSCPDAIAIGSGLRHCTPANVMLLTGIGIGAKAMPACRAREVGLCIVICRRRFC
jgi:hypothetical protein